MDMGDFDHSNAFRMMKLQWGHEYEESAVVGCVAHSSLMVYGLPICALKLRSRMKHTIQVRCLLWISRSRARVSSARSLGRLVGRCILRSMASLPVMSVQSVTHTVPAPDIDEPCYIPDTHAKQHPRPILLIPFYRATSPQGVEEVCLYDLHRFVPSCRDIERKLLRQLGQPRI